MADNDDTQPQAPDPTQDPAGSLYSSPALASAIAGLAQRRTASAQALGDTNRAQQWGDIFNVASGLLAQFRPLIHKPVSARQASENFQASQAGVGQIGGAVADMATQPLRSRQAEQQLEQGDIKNTIASLAARSEAGQQRVAAGTPLGQKAVEEGTLTPEQATHAQVSEVPTATSMERSAAETANLKQPDTEFDTQSPAYRAAVKELGLTPGTPLTPRQLQEMSNVRGMTTARGELTARQRQLALEGARLRLEAARPVPAIDPETGFPIPTPLGSLAGVGVGGPGGGIGGGGGAAGGGGGGGSAALSPGTTPGTAASVPGSTAATAPGLAAQSGFQGKLAFLEREARKSMPQKSEEELGANEDAIRQITKFALPAVKGRPGAFGVGEHASEFVGASGAGGGGGGGFMGIGSIVASGMGKVMDSLQSMDRDPSDTFARSQVFDYVQGIVTNLAGKTQTPSEAARIEQWAPAGNDSAATIVAKLRSILQYAEDKRDALRDRWMKGLPPAERVSLPDIPRDQSVNGPGRPASVLGGAAKAWTPTDNLDRAVGGAAKRILGDGSGGTTGSIEGLINQHSQMASSPGRALGISRLRASMTGGQVPPAFAPYAPRLQKWLADGEDSFGANTYSLAMTDPDFNDLLLKVNNDPNAGR